MAETETATHQARLGHRQRLDDGVEIRWALLVEDEPEYQMPPHAS
jgi:hypothetical protein